MVADRAQLIENLAERDEPQIKYTSAQKLARIGAEIVPTLVELILNDPDRRDGACYALVLVPEINVTNKSITHFLAHDDSEIRSAMASALEEAGDRPGLGDVFAEKLREQDKNTNYHILGVLTPEQAFDNLNSVIALATSDDYMVREQVANVLRKMEYILYKPDNTKEHLLATQAIIKLLQDPVQSVRKYAMRALHTRAEMPIEDDLVALYDSADETIQKDLIRHITALATPTAINKVRNMLTIYAKDDARYIKAVCSLFDFGHDVNDLLIDAMRDADQWQREELYYALSSAENPLVSPHRDTYPLFDDLVMLLQNDLDNNVNITRLSPLIKAVGVTGKADAIPMLIPLLDSDIGKQLRTVFGVLFNLAHRDIVAPLMPFLNHENPMIANRADKAIQRVKSEERLAELVKLLESDAPMMRENAIMLITRIETDDARAILANLGND